MIRTNCRQDIFEWHKWFAWHPVNTKRVKMGSRYCWTTFWWVEIERRAISDGWDSDGWDSCYWEYRLP